MFGDYLSLMLICPVILILSSGVTVFITTQVSLIVEKFSILGNFSSLIFFLLELLPYTLMGILFTFLFIFMPNTKVKFSSGIFAGIITGTVFQLVQWAYITFQIGVVKYNAIYGSFAALPLFLAWLQLSWIIVLYGAEMSFAFQNADAREFEPDVAGISKRLRTLLALLIAGRLVKNFTKGEKPMTTDEISRQLEIPLPLVKEITIDLVKSNIVSAVEIEGSDQRGYQPAIDVNVLTISYVIDAIEKRGADTARFSGNPDFVSLAASLESFDKCFRQLPENKLLKEI